MKQHLKNKSRRLRKKLHLGEFAEYGFQFAADLNGIGLDRSDEVMDHFIGVLEAHSLQCFSVMTSNKYSGFINSADPFTSPLPTDVQLIQKTLESYPEASNVRIGPMIDLWYDEPTEEF